MAPRALVTAAGPVGLWRGAEEDAGPEGRRPPIVNVSLINNPARDVRMPSGPSANTRQAVLDL